MNDFVVSARKYRPKKFETVLGQENITSTLLKAIDNNHLGQAFLFCGPRGVGKTTCARILARVVNEFNKDEDADDTDYSFNIFELDAASNNSVDDIRNLIQQTRVPPQVGKYKVYIIDEVHMLSTSAFNAFLKTLEEPPPYAIFILATTEKHKVLPTILSRCQIFDFNRIGIADMVQQLRTIADKENIHTSDEALHIIAEKADGAMRDALSIFDQLAAASGDSITYENVIKSLNVLDHEHYFKIMEAVLQNDRPSAILALHNILQSGFDGRNFIEGLSNHLRNLLFCTSAQTADILEVGENVKQRYLEQSNKFTTSVLIDALNILSDIDVKYRESKNQRLLVEIALLKLCNLSGTIPEKKNDEAKTIESVDGSKPITTVSNVPNEWKESVLPDNSNAERVKKQLNATALADGSRKASATPQKPEVNAIMADIDLKEGNTKQAGAETEVQRSAESPTTQVSEPKSTYRGKLGNARRKGIPLFSELKSQSRTSDFKTNLKGESDAKLETAAVTTLRQNSFNQADLWKVWDAYCQVILAQNRMSYYATLTKHKPIILDQNKIVLLIDNDVQRTDLEADKLELCAFLRNGLLNDAIQFEPKFDDSESDDGLSLYEPHEKFDDMAARNPNLQLLKDKFDLRIEHDD